MHGRVVSLGDRGVSFDTAATVATAGQVGLVAAATATSYNGAVAGAITHKLVTELLGLPDEERGGAAPLLRRSLEPDGGDELAGKEWETVWAAEIDRCTREVTEGKVELVDWCSGGRRGACDARCAHAVIGYRYHSEASGSVWTSLIESARE